MNHYAVCGRDTTRCGRPVARCSIAMDPTYPHKDVCKTCRRSWFAQNARNVARISELLSKSSLGC